MSLPRYAEYKESGATWLGEVPDHWDLRRLGYYFNERRERVSDVEFAALSVTRNGVVPQLENVAKTDDGGNRKKVCAGDFVINGRSDRKGSSGAASMDGSCSLISIVLAPNDGIRIDFAHHLLRSVPFQEEFYRYGKGIVADLWSTNYSEMKNISLAVPPKDEQFTIVVFLDREIGKIDTLIAEQEKLLTLLSEKRQATISRAVTRGLNPNAPMKDFGVPWLGEVPVHWDVLPLAYRYSVQLGKMLDAAKITGEHLRPYLRVFDVQWGSINTDELPLMDFDEEARTRYRLRSGDLIVNEGGSYPGRSAVWGGEVEECYYQKALHRVRPISDETDTTQFFYYVMSWSANQGVFVAGGNETTIEHLPAEKLRRYRFAFPPIAEQIAISRFLDLEVAKLDNLRVEAESAITLLKERRSTLIAAAVTGKIDVRQAA